MPEQEGFLLAWRTLCSVFCCLLIFLEDKLCSWASSSWQRLVPQVQASHESCLEVRKLDQKGWVTQTEEWVGGQAIGLGEPEDIDWIWMGDGAVWAHCLERAHASTDCEGGLNAWLKYRHEPGEMAVLAPLEAWGFVCAANPASFSGHSIPFTAAFVFSMLGLLHLNISIPHSMMFGSCGPTLAVTWVT